VGVLMMSSCFWREAKEHKYPRVKKSDNLHKIPDVLIIQDDLFEKYV